MYSNDIIWSKLNADANKHHQLIFSQNIIDYSFESTTVFTQSNISPFNERTPEVLANQWKEDAKNSPEWYLTPHSNINQAILAEKLPKTKITKKYENYGVPDLKINQATDFNLVDHINNASLLLPEYFFLTYRDGDSSQLFLDTAMSELGLNAFMDCYANKMSITGKAFKTVDEFIKKLPEIKTQAYTKPVACLVCLWESKRHVTGLYFKNENNQIIAYSFDTTGLTLPAFPCGFRYSYSYQQSFPLILEELEKHQITIGIMPINTVLSIQNDKFSCLMATVLFFEGMRLNKYTILETPGITDCYGHSAFYCDSENKFYKSDNYKNYTVTIYTTSYLPLLVGCQSRLALLFMIDPLQNPDDLLPSIIKYQSDWQRNTSTSKQNSHNVYWQKSYVELLGWFNHTYAYKNTQAIFPDFEKIAQNGCSTYRPKSLLERRVEELSQKAPTIPKKFTLLGEDSCKTRNDNDNDNDNLNDKNDNRKLEQDSSESVCVLF